MLLAIDVGNTNTVLGLYEGRTLVHHWRLKTDRELTADQHAVQLESLFRLRGVAMEQVHDVIVSSVVPPMNLPLAQVARRYFGVEPLFVGPGVRTGIDIRVEEPRAVGADRIVNAVAAYSLVGGPVIVIDFGTATTFDAVSEAGEYLGGAIAPGVQISANALASGAAQIQKVELVQPRSVIGRSTAESLRSGVLLGTAAMVDGMVERMQKELGGFASLIATGGLAPLVLERCSTPIRHEPSLTLQGLRIIFERNASR